MLQTFSFLDQNYFLQITAGSHTLSDFLTALSPSFTGGNFLDSICWYIFYDPPTSFVLACN